MHKNCVIIYCMILCSTEILAGKRKSASGQSERDRIFTEFTREQEEHEKVIHVRTVEELRERHGENVVLDFIGLVEQHEGYTAEEYDVQTDDGYILKLHRISGSPYSPPAPGKPVAYIMHGLALTTDSHVIMGPKHDLTFLLADEGYDVWLGNARGNTYSKRHVKYSPDRNNSDFWNFSMDEIGIIDLPKFIDTVLEKTKQKKLTYIGYSMGTTVVYMLLSEKPEYNSKMSLIVHLAPVVNFNSAFIDIMKFLLLLEPRVRRIIEKSGKYEVFPQTKFAEICGTATGQLFCYSWMYSNIDPSMFPTIARYFPAGTSLFAVHQYYQMATKREFRKFDFGRLNEQKYGSIAPPKYNLSRATAPQAIYCSDRDVYVSVKTVEKVRDSLKNVVIFQEAPSGYNHLDFVWAKDVRTAFYGQVLDGIKKFT